MEEHLRDDGMTSDMLDMLIIQKPLSNDRAKDLTKLFTSRDLHLKERLLAAVSAAVVVMQSPDRPVFALITPGKCFRTLRALYGVRRGCLVCKEVPDALGFFPTCTAKSSRYARTCTRASAFGTIPATSMLLLLPTLLLPLSMHAGFGKGRFRRQGQFP